MLKPTVIFNPFALRTAKTLWSFGRSQCKRVKKSLFSMKVEIWHNSKIWSGFKWSGKGLIGRDNLFHFFIVLGKNFFSI